MDMGSHSVEYRRLFRDLDNVYARTGFRLTAPKPKNVFTTVLFNWVFLLSGLCFIFFVYLLITEYPQRYVVVHQIWAMIAWTQYVINTANRQIHWDNVHNLLQWFDAIFAEKYPRDYQVIMEKRFKRMNSMIKICFR